MTVAAELSGFAGALTWGDVPEPLHGKLADHILDTLGVMCVGARTMEHRALRGAVAGRAGVGAATVIAGNGRASARDAALCNAFAGRIHTFDDTLEAGPVHSGSAVIAAALAASEAVAAPGIVFLRAVFAGYEVAARITLGLGAGHYAKGFHPTGTCNAFGAAVAAALAQGLDQAGIRGAIGMAGGMASGLRQHQLDGSMADSALNGAHAAMVGVLAADLAAAGLSGPTGIIDGPLGVGALMAEAPDYAAMVAGLGRVFEFARTSLKPYPSCRFTHGPVHEAIRLVRQGIVAADQIKTVELYAFGQSVEVSDRPNFRTRTEALLSHQFTLAVALRRGALTFADLEAAVIADPDIRALAGRISVIHEVALDERYPAAWPHRLCIRLDNGQRIEAVSDNPPGGVGQPMPPAEVAAKFRGNAEPVLGRDRASAVIDTVRGLAGLDDVRRLGELLRDGPAGAELTDQPGRRPAQAAE